MEFKTHNEKDINANLTHLQGYIEMDFITLQQTFGEPLDGDGDKTDAEWEIEFKDGVVATIYNYKNGRNFAGAAGKAVPDIKKWNIGGHASIVVDRIEEILNTKGE